MSDLINIWDYLDNNYPFQIFIGGRGTGKTYSALGATTSPEKRNTYNINKFIYLRRTKDDADILQDNEKDGEGANPYKKLNEDLNAQNEVVLLCSCASGTSTNVALTEKISNFRYIYFELLANTSTKVSAMMIPASKLNGNINCFFNSIVGVYIPRTDNTATISISNYVNNTRFNVYGCERVANN